MTTERKPSAASAQIDAVLNGASTVDVVSEVVSNAEIVGPLWSVAVAPDTTYFQFIAESAADAFLDKAETAAKHRCESNGGRYPALEVFEVLVDDACIVRPASLARFRFDTKKDAEAFVEELEGDFIDLYAEGAVADGKTPDVEESWGFESEIVAVGIEDVDD